MATLIFKCELRGNRTEYDRVEIYHGDNCQVKAWKKIVMSGVVMSGYEDKTVEHAVLPTYDELISGKGVDIDLNHWRTYVNDPTSEEEYEPIYVSHNSVRDTGDLEEFIEMYNLPTYEEMSKLALKHNLDAFVIKHDAPVYLTNVKPNMYDSFISYTVMTTSMPKKLTKTIRWTAHLENIWPRICKGDPTKYAKEPKVMYLEGEDGKALVGHFGDVSQAWHYLDERAGMRYLEGEVTLNYSEPYEIPQEEKDRIARALIEKENRRQEIERLKRTPGHCCHCGTNQCVERVDDPFRGIHAYYCSSCYDYLYN